MKNFKKNEILNFAMHASAAIFALTLSGAILLGAIVLTIEPVFAQGVISTLLPSEVSVIQSSLASAISSANAASVGRGSDAKAAALEAAIQQVELNAISTYGIAADGDITSALLGAPALAGIASYIVGTALGDAAAIVAATYGIEPAMGIADAVANEGPSGSQTAFADALRALGGSSSVADAATSTPTVTGASGFSGVAGPSGLTGGFYGTRNPGCRTPSCS